MKKIILFILALPIFCHGQIIKKIDASSMWLRPNTATLYASTSSITGLTTVAGTASTPGSFTIQGDNLTASAVTTAPSWLEISFTSGSGYTSPLTSSQSGGNLVGEPVTIYYRIKASESAGSKSGTITVTSASAPTINISVSGTVTTEVTPDISLSTTTVTLPTTEAGTAGSSVSFNASGTNLSGNISISSNNSNLGLSTNNSTFVTTPITLTPSAGTVTSTPIYARIMSTASAGSVTATITASSSGATNKTISASGTATEPETGDPQIAKVNLFASGTGVGQISDGTWNNRGIGSGSNIALSAFNWTDGSASGITGVISSITNLNDNGSSWAVGGTTNFPQEVIRLSPSSSSNPITLALNNMPSGTYTIRIMSSRSVSGSRETTFTSGSATSTVQAQNNTTTEAVLTGLTPSSGTIVITITSTVSSGTSVYLNAFIIEKN